MLTKWKSFSPHGLSFHFQRHLQEKKLRATSKGKKTMNPKQIKNFIMFYERLTKHMLKNFDKKANFIIKIDDKHKLKSIKFN